MSRTLIRDALAQEQQLALAYAPADVRDSLMVVMGLDMRLARLVSAVREPLLAQIRLAWWRDRLTDIASGTGGEPLLDLIRGTDPDVAPLLSLVDAWEALLSEPESARLADLATARAAAICTVSARSRHDPASHATAREWALHDLSRLPGQWGDLAGDLANGEVWAARRLPRALRPLAVLHAIARRQRRTGRDPGPASIVVALRVGLFGR